MEAERKILRPFGESVYVHIQPKGKLSERAAEARIVGFTPTYGIYKVLLSNRQVTTAKNPRPRIRFTSPLTIEEEEKERPVSPQPEHYPTPPPAPVKKISERKFPTGIPMFQPQQRNLPGSFPQSTNLEDSRDIPRQSSCQNKGIDSRIPLDEDPKYTQGGSQQQEEAHLTMTEALGGDKAEMWSKAKNREIAQLERYGVIEWVDQVPAGKKIVDTKWVLLEKLERTDDKRYKARLTARGFTQRPGIDYDEIYAPVCREETWRMLIATALAREMIIRQFNIEAAFLNGPIEEEIYVRDEHATGKKAWRLRKALYGLKQAARNWNLVIDDLLQGMGYKKCDDDQGLYVGEKGLICIHVDDLLCAFYSEEQQKEWEETIASHVTLEHRGQPKKFLGMTMHWEDKRVTITGADAIERLAETFHITKLARTPFLTGTERQDEMCDEATDTKTYQAMVGALLFIARMWRPDIRYVVARLCINTAAPRAQDVMQAQKSIGYLLSTK